MRTSKATWLGLAVALLIGLNIYAQPRDGVIYRAPLSASATNTFTGSNTFGTGGSAIKKILVTTCSVNPDSIAAAADGSGTCTVTGAASGDAAICNVSGSDLDDNLSFKGCKVTGANTITIYFRNNAAATPIDDGAVTWTVTLIDVT